MLELLRLGDWRSVVKVRAAWDPRVSVKLEIPSDEKRLVDSSFKAESDINTIVARYRKTGVLGDEARRAAAQYGDFSAVPTFAEMQEKVIAANALFAALPAVVRKQFDNDPGAFLRASETAEGRELMVKLGLGKEPDTEEPQASDEPPVPAPKGGQEPKAPAGPAKAPVSPKKAKAEEPTQE